MMRFISLAAGLGLLLPASAILVADDSPCGTLCGNVLDSTAPDDITCSETSYMSGNGAVFQQCVNCEMSSTYQSDDNETDTEWALYNLRYAAAYCLFGVPNNDDVINSPCLTSTACGPFKDSIIYKNLSSKVDGYDYCDSWPVNRTDEFNGCTSCLKAGNEYYLSNFITVLQAGCEQKPVPGITLSLEGGVFSDDVVNITSPTPTASVNPDWFDHGVISLGGKVGIAFGGFAFVLFVLGFFIVWNGKRRRKAFLRKLENKRNSSWPGPIDTSPQDMRETRDTPLSQRPLRGWDDSPMSTRSEKPFPPHHHSPFSSQYSSPVSATELRLANWPVMGAHPQYQQFESHSTLMVPGTQYQMTPEVQPTPSPANVGHGSEVSSLESSKSGKGKQLQESYEMQPVEGGTHQHYQQVVSSHSLPPQGYFDGTQVHPSQIDPTQLHPGQMFPNMYQQHAKSGPIGFEEDAKK